MVEQASRIAAEQAARERDSGVEYLDVEDVEEEVHGEEGQHQQHQVEAAANESKTAEALPSPREYGDKDNNGADEESNAKSDMKKAQADKIKAMIEEAKAHGAPW